MNIAIVEDFLEDRLWLSKKLKIFMEKNNLSYTLHEFDHAEDFVKSLDSTSYFMVFMDIYFNGMSGMEAAVRLRQLDPDCKLIFITSTADYALEGYSVQASHYLVKPVSDQKFQEAMQNCKIQPRYEVPFLSLSTNNGPVKLDTGQIHYIHLEGRTVYIHTTKKIHAVSGAFSRITEPLLSDRRFLLCIQGIMVNMDYISGHEGSVFILKNGERIPINLRNKKRVLQQYRDYMFENMERNI